MPKGQELSMWGFPLWFSRYQLIGQVTKCETDSLLDTGLPDFSRRNIPKREKNIPNCHKMYQIAIKYNIWMYNRQNGPNNTNIFHCRTFQNLPKFGFWVWKYTIWQHWLDMGELSWRGSRSYDIWIYNCNAGVEASRSVFWVDGKNMFVLKTQQALCWVIKFYIAGVIGNSTS
jgi:hypothetical protein